MGDSSDAVQVAVRVRPLSRAEASQGSELCVDVVDSSVLLAEKQFDFDAALPAAVQQESVYATLVAPMIEQFFDGYNATVFAYGQTGSGKTYTMGNAFASDVAPEQRGVIPRVIKDMFERVQASANPEHFVVKLSYLEILNEEIRDLLDKTSLDASTLNAGLTVRGDGDRGIIVTGLSEHIVQSVGQAGDLLRSGALVRATACTSMNAQSSRSHAICTVAMEQHDLAVEEGTETRYSKFHLVDLAGSERVSRTNSEGARFKEGVNINRGLLALGNVINALCERGRSSSLATHIPYRDSKLTRLLQDSLGGNSKTLMIACVSPADVNYEETSSTLRYASRTRKITNQAVVNKERSAENEVAYLKQQLAIVQLQLLQQSRASRPIDEPNPSADDGAQASSVGVGSLEDENRRLRAQLALAISAKDKWKKVADDLAHKSDTEPKLAPTKALLSTPIKALVGAATGRRDKTERSSKSGQLSRLEQLRKFQNQKMQSSHAKEGAAVKRKVAGAVSVNPGSRALRLPSPGASSSKRSSPQARRGPVASSPGKRAGIGASMGGITKLLQQVMTSQEAICSAKEAVRVNVAEREALAHEVSRLRLSSEAPEKVSQLQDELRSKTATIRLLQQKLASVEKAVPLPSGLFPPMLDTCHELIRHLVESMLESREEYRTLLSCRDELDAANEKMLARNERDRLKMQALEAKLEDVAGSLRGLREQATKKKAAKKRKRRESYETLETLFSSSDEEVDNSKADPDYLDEEERRKRVSKKKRTPAAVSKSADMLEEIDEMLETSAATCCSCHGKCATKACTCKSQSRVCSEECSCNVGKCRNRESGSPKSSGAVGNSLAATSPESAVSSAPVNSVQAPATPERRATSADSLTGTEEQTTMTPGATALVAIDLMSP